MSGALTGGVRERMFRKSGETDTSQQRAAVAATPPPATPRIAWCVATRGSALRRPHREVSRMQHDQHRIRAWHQARDGRVACAAGSRFRMATAVRVVAFSPPSATSGENDFAARPVHGAPRGRLLRGRRNARMRALHGVTQRADRSLAGCTVTCPRVQHGRHQIRGGRRCQDGRVACAVDSRFARTARCGWLRSRRCSRHSVGIVFSGVAVAVLHRRNTRICALPGCGATRESDVAPSAVAAPRAQREQRRIRAGRRPLDYRRRVLPGCAFRPDRGSGGAPCRRGTTRRRTTATGARHTTI